MPRPEQGGVSLRAVLTLPHAGKLFAAATLARFCYALLGIPLLLTLRQATGSFALAGTATGAFGLLVALLGPLRARLVERHHAVLPCLGAAYALCLGALAVVCRTGAPDWVPLALAALAGLFPPPVGPLMRTLWGALAADDAQVQRALSLDTAAESTVFAVGPVAGGVLVTATSAPATLVACAALALAAFALLTAALRHAPEGIGRRTGGGRGATALRVSGFPPLLLLVVATSLALCGAEVALIAVRGAAVTGVLLAVFSAGGVLGGLLYGRRQWPGSLARRPLAITVAACACYAALALPHLLPVTAAAVLLAGGCADVLLVTAYQLVELRHPAGSRTEAGAWVNAAWNLGTAFGPAAAGILVDHHAPWTVFVTAAAVLGGSVVLSAPLTPKAHTPPQEEAATEQQPAPAA